MISKSVLCVLLLSFLAVTAQAAEDVSATIKKILNTPDIVEFREYPLPGMYEVFLPNNSIVYVNLERKLIFAGQIFSSDGKSLTAERVSEIVGRKIEKVMKESDRNKALKIGSGPVELIEFTDIDCPYCRQAEDYFKDKEDVFTRYLYFLPAPNHIKSTDKTKYILSQADAVSAYKTAIAGGLDAVIPEFTESSTAGTLLVYYRQLQAKTGIQATPIFFWSDGYSQGLDTKALDKIVEKIRSEKPAKK
jgi:thiol:disulfide interchange protein DsbC